MFTDVWSDSTGTGPPDSDSGEEFLRLPEKLGPNASPGVSKVIIYFVGVLKWFMFAACCDQIETAGHLTVQTEHVVICLTSSASDGHSCWANSDIKKWHISQRELKTEFLGVFFSTGSQIK
jgi:hypothetical protein